MRALVFNNKNLALKLKEIPVPELTGPTSVLVAPKYGGVCGTDLHIVKGEFPAGNNVVLGHETSGIVVAVGSQVVHVKPGDQVVVDPNNSGCGNVCENCTVAKYHLCHRIDQFDTVGIGKDGGFAETMEVPMSQVYLLPNDIKLENGFIIETLSCVIHGRDLLGPLDPGANIHILGGGIVGLLWGSLLHHQGYRNLTISEPRATRRETAIKLNIFKEVYDPVELAQKNSSLKLPPYNLVIDCCGVARAIQPAIDWIKRGGTLMIFACAAPSQDLQLNLFKVYQKELRLFGVTVNPYTFPKAIALMSAMQERYLNIQALGIMPFTLDEHEKTFAQLGQGEITKGVFVI